MGIPVSLALLGGGAVLVFFGMEASRSLLSGVSRFFSGLPTEKTRYMLVGGAFLCVVGTLGLMHG